MYHSFLQRALFSNVVGCGFSLLKLHFITAVLSLYLYDYLTCYLGIVDCLKFPASVLFIYFVQLLYSCDVDCS